MTLFFFIIPMPGYLFGIGYLFYSIYSMKKRNDNIGHEAHLGGAIAGFFTTLLISPIVLINNMFTVAVLLIPIVYFYIKTSRNW
jgi:membrane associated rhomboid family serine protease